MRGQGKSAMPMRGQGKSAMPMWGQGNKTIYFLKQIVLLVESK